MGWYGVHIVQWVGIEFTLFSAVILSSHCSVGWFGVHIVLWGGLEFRLFFIDRVEVWSENKRWSVENSWSGWREGY